MSADRDDRRHERRAVGFGETGTAAAPSAADALSPTRKASTITIDGTDTLSVDVRGTGPLGQHPRVLRPSPGESRPLLGVFRIRM